MGNDRNDVPPADVETLRQRAIDRVRALKRENAPRVSDPAWTSYTGYNYRRWADRGFNIALGLLDRTAPLPGETGPDYLKRVAATHAHLVVTGQTCEPILAAAAEAADRQAFEARPLMR